MRSKMPTRSLCCHPRTPWAKATTHVDTILTPHSPDDASLPQSRQMALATDVEAQTIEYIASTRRDRYFIFTQPGLQAADFKHMPKLRQRVSKLKDGEGAYVQIPEVVGGVSVETIAASMVGKMGIGATGGMREQEMPALSSSMSESDRAVAVAMTGMLASAWHRNRLRMNRRLTALQTITSELC